VIVGLLVLVIAGLARGPVVGSLASTAAVKPAIEDVWSVATELLHAMAVSVMVSGVFILIEAWLGGPSRPAVAFRRGVAPYLRHHPAISASCVALAFLVLVWWAPTHGFRTAVGLIINAAIFGGGFLALLFMTRSEFPDAEPPDVGDWARRTFDSSRDRVAHLTSGAGRGAHHRAMEKQLDSLERLSQLHASGALTDSEFERQKAELLGAGD